MSDLYLTHARYLAALKRQRARIAGGIALVTVDDDTPGNKTSSCTWGLCSDEVDAWPDADDHLWPDQFVSTGRVAPLYSDKGQFCPLDRRDRESPIPGDTSGCFWRCRAHRPKGEKLTRGKALALYDERIADAEKKP